MPRLAPHFIRLGFFVAFGFVAPLARADVVSSELRSKGNDAMDRLDYAEALDAYEKARAADPNDVAVLYNIGRVQQAREDFRLRSRPSNRSGRWRHPSCAPDCQSWTSSSSR
jgi:tetratricopeptide (TPR) repeat protein